MIVGGTFYRSIPLSDPSTGLPAAAQDTRCTVRKNGADTLDSVTITQDGSKSYLYHLSYNPAGESAGDQYVLLLEAQFDDQWYACPPIAFEIDQTTAGTGERTITVHVTNASGGADLDGCSVTIKDSANLVKGKVEATDVNGEGEVYVDDGPYTVIVSRDGFITKGQAVTVSGDATVEVELTANLPTASDPGYVTGYIYTDINGVRTSGATAVLTVVGRPTSGSNATGLGVEDDRTVLSDVDGLAEWNNLVPGAKYKVTYAGVSVETTIPSDATGSVPLNSIMGAGA